ncbi:MAG: hypothetical protein E6I95_11265 [Chloroflexi bacterium]|nr:MAG: hypothetical protein E6I95_11265 [Chloroflexota bacterium]
MTRTKPMFAAVAFMAMAIAACQPGTNTHPVPSVAQIGSDLNCPKGDHGFEDSQVGWGFCYPASWKYNERPQASTNPPGLDLTFDITDIPCASPPPGTASARPICSPNAGLFAFMIISTYERGSSDSLASWLQANTASPSPSPPALQPITWGNSTQAARLADGRRIALTQHHVVILDLRSGQGHLDLETEMSARLGTWKFSY